MKNSVFLGVVAAGILNCLGAVEEAPVETPALDAAGAAPVCVDVTTDSSTCPAARTAARATPACSAALLSLHKSPDADAFVACVDVGTAAGKTRDQIGETCAAQYPETTALYVAWMACVCDLAATECCNLCASKYGSL